MSGSTHKVEVVPLHFTRHPNADRLSVAHVYGYTCVTTTDEWRPGQLAAYVPPDSLVPVGRPEFAFLAGDADSNGKARVRARKFRGVVSFGLLVPAPEGARPGDDVAAELGVTHYEPPVKSHLRAQGGVTPGGDQAEGPPVAAPKYDVESGRRYGQSVFVPGEPVVVTEKLHGCNARYVFAAGRVHCGSRTEWKREFPGLPHVTPESLAGQGLPPDRAQEIVEKLRNQEPRRNLWWQALHATPTLGAFLVAHPGLVVYGEVYGAVQDLSYGHGKGEVSFAAFDLMRDGKFLDAEECRLTLEDAGVPQVPLLNHRAPGGRKITPVGFDFESVCELAEGKTLLGGGHVREGVVVKPLKERHDPRTGRAVLKWVGAGYLERAKPAEEE